jgi:hypothetical protein
MTRSAHIILMADAFALLCCCALLGPSPLGWACLLGCLACAAVGLMEQGR